MLPFPTPGIFPTQGSNLHLCVSCTGRRILYHWDTWDFTFFQIKFPGSGRSAGGRVGYPLQYSWASFVAQLVKILLQCGRPGFDPWVGKIPWRRERLPTPVFWPGKFHIVHGIAKSWTQLNDFSLHFTSLLNRLQMMQNRFHFFFLDYNVHNLFSSQFLFAFCKMNTQ